MTRASSRSGVVCAGAARSIERNGPTPLLRLTFVITLKVDEVRFQ
jgi:hypothetical protein